MEPINNFGSGDSNIVNGSNPALPNQDFTRPPSVVATAPVSQPHQNSVEAHSFNDSKVKAEDSGGSFYNTYATVDEGSSRSEKPLPVVKVLSVRGVEYGMMTITLWVAAASLASGLITLISGNASFTILAMPISILLVTIPVFSFFFIRLKKAEIKDPSLVLDPSKRRFSQITQFVAFLACLINITVFVFLIVASFGGDTKTSWGKAVGNLLVILAIAGGILAYYWVNEHRLAKD